MSKLFSRFNFQFTFIKIYIYIYLLIDFISNEKHTLSCFFSGADFGSRDKLDSTIGWFGECPGSL